MHKWRLKKIAGKQTLIMDEGSVDRVNIIDVVVGIICIVLILIVVALGVMAIVAG